jgi:hypothetical protein
LKRLLLICGLCLLAAPAAWAAHAQPLAFYDSLAHLSQSVSQQPGVTNPTAFGTYKDPFPCGWDAQDSRQRDAVLNSELAGGATVTDTMCLFQDWSPRVIVTNIAASSPDLSLTVAFNTGGSTAVTPTYDSRLRLWVYKACVIAPTYQPGDPALQTIAGSNGGVAVPTTVSLTITNPSSKTAGTVRYYWGYSPGSC